MSAAHSLPSGSPTLIYWSDRTLRHIAIGDCHHRISEDLAIVMDALLKASPAPVTTNDIIFDLWAARGKDEPEEPEKNVRVKVCYLRKRFNMPIENVFGSGYRLLQPGQEFFSGRTYTGAGDVGDLHLLKVIHEPMLLLRDPKSGEEYHIPLSGARLMGLQEVAERSGP